VRQNLAKQYVYIILISTTQPGDFFTGLYYFNQ